jgi:arabinofuranosyltransferase
MQTLSGTTKASDQSALSPFFLKAVEALPYLVLLAAVYHVFSFTSAGAFVTFRYAANMLAGHGAVYNPGQHVEGYTSSLFLMLTTILMMGFKSVGIYFKLKILGVLFAIFGLWLVRKLALSLGLSSNQAVAAQLLVAVTINYACSAVNGLETSLYICLVLASTIVFIHERDGRKSYASAGLLFLALVTRPDAALLFTLFFGLSLWDVIKRRSDPGRLCLWTAAYLVPTVIFLVFRHSYYGQWVPNTYFAKHVAHSVALKAGLIYLVKVLSPSTISRSIVWIALSATIYYGLAILGLWENRHRRNTLALVLAIASSVIFILSSGGGAGLGWRYVEPAAPFLAILQVWAITHIAQRFGPKWGSIKPQAIVTLVVVALFGSTQQMIGGQSWSAAHFSTDDTTLLVSAPGQNRSVEWAAAAALVRSQIPTGSTVGGWDTEYLAYENPNDQFLDFRGLTDTEIASLPISYKSIVGIKDHQWFHKGDRLNTIIMRRKPAFIITYDQPNLKVRGYALKTNQTVKSRIGPIYTVQIHKRVLSSNTNQ